MRQKVPRVETVIKCNCTSSVVMPTASQCCNYYYILWFQKISIPPPQRELEIPKGRGFKDPGISGGDWSDGWLGFQISFDSIQFKYWSSCSKILSYLPSRTFRWKTSGLNTGTCIWIALYLKYNFLSSKSTLEANKSQECAVVWK